MHITTIEIDGILGISSIAIKPATAIQFFAGFNHSGKSSIRDSVALAIAQETARGVKLKKNYDVLVNDGCKQGGATIIMDGDEDKVFAFNMPDGKFSGPEISEAMRISINGQRFSAMAPDDRRTFLLDLTKSRMTPAALKERLTVEKVDTAKIDAVLPLARAGGFPSMCEHAKKKATEAKGAWRGITGENWGSDKAPKWEATMPDDPGVDVALLRSTLADEETSIATMNESLGNIKAAARATLDNATKRATLADTVKKIPDLQAQLELAKGELAKYEPTVVALRARAGGTARIGLVHDMAEFLHTTKTTDAKAAITQALLLSKYEKEHGPIGAKSDPEAQASLPEHERGLLVMQNRVKNLQRDLDAATMAKGQYDALEPDSEVVDAGAEIEEITSMISAAVGRKTQVLAQITAAEATHKARLGAAEKTENALKHHTDVMEWTAVANLMAPDGIPSEQLASAMGPVNSTLEQAALDSEWAQVRIGDDTEIYAEGRPYHLLSESEQWRADAMIAYVVAKISDIKIILLDRCDVLDLKSRSQLFGWLDVCVAEKEIDSVLLFATLKSLPEPEMLMDNIEAHWLENGVITKSIIGTANGLQST